MTFAWPQMFWLLAAPLALLGRELARRRRADPAGHPKIIRAEAGARTLQLAAAGPGRGGRSRPSWWLAAGLFLAVAALARPQWGRVEHPAVERSREILIALDLSRSMLTTDVPPSRLGRAKLLVRSLLDHLQGERVGLEVFAGTAFVQAPLSGDYDILREFLPALGPDSMPVGGTNYGALIDAAAGAFSRAAADDGRGPAADRFLVVLSDGGATDDDWRAHVGRLKDLGIRVVGLGVGTPTGALIPDGAGGYLKDGSGAVVMSRLESDTLRELAQRTGGVYRDAGDWVDLPALLKSTVEAGRQGTFVERTRVSYAERYQWALVPALFCLLMSFWREFPVQPKPRDVRLGPASRESTRSRETSAEFSRIRLHPEIAALVCLLAFALPAASGADEASGEPGAPLARIVGRLAGQDRCDARDWREMAEESVAWGKQIQDAHQPVPAGPIDDALAAVDAGSTADPGLTDWPRLRAQLQALRQKQEQPKPPPQPKPQPKRQQSGSGGAAQQQQNQSPTGGQPPSTPRTPQSSNAGLGGMRSPSPPPPDNGGRQQVGGAAVNPPPGANYDSSIIGPLQKLDRVRDDDSPARLFQMMENNEPHPPPTTGKDW